MLLGLLPSSQLPSYHPSPSLSFPFSHYMYVCMHLHITSKPKPIYEMASLQSMLLLHFLASLVFICVCVCKYSWVCRHHYRQIYVMRRIQNFLIEILSLFHMGIISLSIFGCVRQGSQISSHNNNEIIIEDHFSLVCSFFFNFFLLVDLQQ